MSDMWTDDRIELLKKYENMSRSQIAERINGETGSSFSRNAIIGKLHRLGIVSTFSKEAATKRHNTNKAVRKNRQARVALVFDGPNGEIKSKIKVVLPRRPVDGALGIEPLNVPYAAATKWQCGFICSAADAPLLVCGHAIAPGLGAASWRPGSAFCPHHHEISHLKKGCAA